MTASNKAAPYAAHPLAVALVRATARPAAPAWQWQGATRNLVDLVQMCLLVQRQGGDSNAVKRTAYRVGLGMTPEHRQTAALVINNADALDLIQRFEDIYME